LSPAGEGYDTVSFSKSLKLESFAAKMENELTFSRKFSAISAPSKLRNERKKIITN
jgi:hypothetical protein